MSTELKSNAAPMKPSKSQFCRAWLGWLLWLTTLAGLCVIRYGGVQRDAIIQQSQQSLLVLMERVDQTLVTMDSKRVVAALAQQDGNFQTIQTRMEKSASDLVEALKQQKDVNGRIQTVLGPQGGNIEDAVRLAEEAKSAGNKELALVYLVNAIRSQPRDIQLLEKYAAWVVESNNPTIMQGAETLLQGALYGVAANDVLEVAARLEDVTRARVTEEKRTEMPIGNIPTPADSFAELGKAPLESFSGDRSKVEARTEALSSVLVQIDESDQPDFKLRDQVNERMEEAQACALAHQILDLAALRFNNLAITETLLASQLTDTHRTAALSALQATEAVVNQVWSVPVARITPELREALIVLPERLKAQAEKIQDSVGREDVKIARKEWEGRTNQSSVKIQDRIIGCQAAIESCSKTLGKVQGPDSRKSAADLYTDMAKEMKELKTKQFAEYQKWATTVIEATRRHFDGSNKLLGDDVVAYAAFYEKDIQKIDQSLLIPEVAQFLQAVVPKLLKALDAEGQAQLQRDMVFSAVTKKTLEDF